MKYAFFTLAAVLLCAGQSVAAVKYWDINGATAGAGGATPAGNWNTSTANWTTDATGSSAATTFTSATDSAIFAAGNDATGSYTVTIPSPISAASVAVEEGTVTLTTTGALTTQTITISSGAALFTKAALGLVASPGASITLNGGTIGNSNTGTGGSFLSSGTTNSNMGIILGTGGGHVSANGGAAIVSIYTGLISGTGPLTVDGNGVFRLTTTTATYSGATTINGTLQISTTANVLPSGTDLTISTGGKFDEQASQQVASLAGAGALAFTNSATVLTVSGATDTSFTGAVTGAGAFTKVGNSTITIGSDWANTGATTVNGGTIKYGSGAAGLSTGSTIAINNGGTVDMNSINDTFGSVSSTAGQTTGVLSMGSGNTLHLGQTATTGRAYDGKITGSGTLDKAGSTFTQTLNGDNSGFTGPITITLGKIAVGNANALGTTANGTSVASGAELLFDGAANSYSIAEPISIAGVGADGGAITVQNASNTSFTGAVTLTADATVTTSSTATSTYSNANAFTASNFNLTLQGGSGAGGGGTVSGAISLGTGSLTKAQTGKWVLTSGNTYSGGTTISAGTLLANNTTGSATGSGAVTVNSTGTLGGTGTVAGAVTVNAGGTISPGDGVGQLNVGALSFVGTNATLKSEINSTLNVNLATAADLLNVNGNLSIGAGAKLSLVDVGSPSNVFAGDTKFTLISYSGTWDNGTFTGAADDSIVSVGLNQYVINYNDTTGGSNFGGGAYSNYVTLTAVPEANAALLGCLVTLVVGVAVGGRKLFGKSTTV